MRRLKGETIRTCVVVFPACIQFEFVKVASDKLHKLSGFLLELGHTGCIVLKDGSALIFSQQAAVGIVWLRQPFSDLGEVHFSPSQEFFLAEVCHFL